MTPSDTIRLQALKLKELNTRNMNLSMSEHLIESAVQQNPDQKELRNICALISAERFKEVEDLCNMLDLSKRVFVEMALGEFIIKANSIVQEVNPLSDEA
jgi:hypothetical protein